MQNKYAEVTPRNFNPTWAPALSDEARKAVNAAFDAMSTWRIETASNSEKNSEQVIEKLEHVPPQLNQGDSRGAKDGRVYRH